MSTHVENQVVSMQFDNKHFESNVKTSLSTLEKLKQSLKLQGAAKGFDNISTAAKKVDLSTIGNSAQAVVPKFSALYTAADYCFRKILNSADRLSSGLASALTIDPVKTGFAEYELKMGSIQTIMASTGESLATVNTYLNELNEYSDKTIYSFSDMTQNIGKFTNAGVKLKDAVAAIKGISNVAAVSGANANEASRAMYNFAQALSAGYVKLIDWKSIELANMATVEFKNQLLESAVAAGKLTKTHDGMYKTLKGNTLSATKNFNETLTDQWMTTEVLINTLGDYADETTEIGKKAKAAAQDVKTFTMLKDTLKESAQSGWAQTWELLVGNFNESKTLWTTLSEVFGKIISDSAEARNSLLSGALDNSGWDKVTDKLKEQKIAVADFEEAVKEAAKKHGLDIEALVEDYGTLEKAVQKGKISVDILKKALTDVIGKKGQWEFEEYTVKAGDTLSDLAEQWNTSIEEIQFLNKIENPDLILTGQILKIPKAVKKVKGDVEDFAELLEKVTDLGGRELLHESVINAWSGLTTIFKEIGKAWKTAFPPMTSERLMGIIQKVRDFSEHLKVSDETAGKLGRTFNGVFAVLDIITTVIGGGLKFAFETLNAFIGEMNFGILDVMAAIGDSITKFRDNIDKEIDAVTKWIEAFYQLPEVQNLIIKFGDELDKIKSSISEKWDEGTKRFTEWIESLKNMDGITLDNVKKAFKDFKTNVIDFFLKNKNGEGIFDGLVSAITNLWNAAKTSLGETGTKLMEFKDKIVAFFTGIKEVVGDKLGSGLAIATLLGFFWSIKKVFDGFGVFTDLIKGFTKGVFDFTKGFVGFIDNFGDAITRVSRGISANLKAQAIKSIAISIAILAGALIALSYVPIEQLKPALLVLLGVTAILGTFAIVLTKFVKEKDLAQLSGLILALGASLLMFAYTAKILGSMNPTEMSAGVFAIAGLITAITIIAAVTKGMGSGLKDFGKMMIKLSVSLLLMAAAVRIFGMMDKGTLKQGIGVVTFLLAEMIVLMAATNLLAKADKARSISKIGGMMLSFGAALLMMSATIGILGKMDIATLTQGIVAITVLLVEMAGLMLATRLLTKLDKGQSFVKIGGIMASLGAALLMMSAAVAILGNLDTSTLVQGGLAVTAFMGIMLVIMTMSKKLVTDGGTAAKAGLVMLEFAGAMVLLTGVIVVLGMLKVETLFKAVTAISVIGLVFAAMIKATAGMTKQIGMVIALAAAIGILAVALAALSFIDDADLLKTAAALGGVMAMLALLVASTKFISLKAALAVTVMGVVVAGLAYVIKDLSDIPADQALDVAKALSILILSLSASAALLGTIGLIGPAALIGVGVLAVLLATIAGFAAIGLLALPAIGKQLSAFMKELDPFIVGMGKMTDAGILNGVKTLSEAIALLTESALSYSFGGADTMDASFDKFLGWISELLPVIKEFAIELGGDDININTDNLDAIMTAVRTLAEVSSLAPRDKTYAWGAYVETTNLSALTDWIKEVMPIITDEALKLSGDDITINSENLDAVTGAAKTLAEAAALAPTEHNLSVDLPKVGANYVSAVMLGEFSKWVTDVFNGIGDKAIELSNLKDANTGKKFDIDADAVGAIADAGAALAKAASEIDPIVTKQGVFGDTYTETDNLTAFSDFITGVYSAISGEAQTLSNLTDDKGKKIKIDTDAVKAVATAGEALIKAADGLDTSLVTKTGVFGDTYTETDNLTAFTNFITGVYSAISSEAEKLSNLTDGKGKKIKIDGDAVKDIATAGEALIKAADGLDTSLVTKTGVFGETYTETDNLTAFTNFITGVYSAISSEAEKLSKLTDGKGKKIKIDGDAVKDIATAGESLISAASGLDSSIVSKTGVFGTTYTETENLTAFTNFITGVYTAVSSEAEKLSKLTDDNGKKIKIDTDAVKAIATVGETMISAASSVDSSIVSKTGVFGTTYTETENLTAFTNFITGVYNAISTEAQNLATLADGEGSIAKIDPKVITAVATAGESLITAASGINYATVSKTGVFGTSYTETENLTAFTDFVTGVYSALSTEAAKLATVEDSSGNIAKIDSDAVKTIATAGVELANAAAAVPQATEQALKIGDLEFTSIKGSDITGFTEWLNQILPAIQQFSVDVSGDTIKPEAVTAVANAGLILAEMANTLTGEGLFDKIVKLFTGEDKWTEFADGLAGFGSAMTGFSKTLVDGNLNNEAVQAASNAGLMLSQAFLALDDIGYYLSDETIAQFDSFLGKFGTALNGFSNDVKDIDDASISTASSAISGIASAMATLQSFPYDQVDVPQFKAKCVELTTAISEFTAGAGSIDPSGAIANINSLIGMLTTVGTTEFTGASSFKTALTDLASTSISDFTDKFKAEDTLTAIKTAGTGLMDQVAAGITAGAEGVGSAADGAADAGYSAITTQENYDAYKTAGAFVGFGFVAGISSMLGSAAAAGTALGNAALAAAKAALDEHSPSKAFYEVGEFAGIGLVNALYDYERTTYKAGYGVGESAKFGLIDAVSRVQNLIENGIGDQPTIRPVLDLSDVSAGADGINRMFNMNPSVGVSASVGNIGALVDQVQNGGNDDVIAAIKGLGSKISESGRDTYNINGVTYDDGSNITETVKSLVRAVLVEGRV